MLQTDVQTDNETGPKIFKMLLQSKSINADQTMDLIKMLYQNHPDFFIFEKI